MCLVGVPPLAEAVNATQVENLFFIPAGNCPPNPVNLLNSQIFKDLLGHLRGDYKYVIFDTPPIIGFADGRIISSMADGVIMVFKHHSTSREAARLATQLLGQTQAHIIGGILNIAGTMKNLVMGDITATTSTITNTIIDIIRPICFS